MSGFGEAVAEASAGATSVDLEEIFRTRYARIARAIAAIVHDRGRAEELAVEAFLALARSRAVTGDNTDAWLWRTAVRLGLDELRRQARRARYERLLAVFGAPPTPEEIHEASQRQLRVRAVLRAIARRDAEILLLRTNGLSYGEIAEALGLNAASTGTLLARARKAFRKEYVRRYGDEC